MATNPIQLVASKQTAPSHHEEFLAELDLPPVNNKPTTYQIKAVFEGDNPRNATVYATAPDGTTYPACTTIEYGYLPASNSITITAKPQSSEVAVPTKTPKQFQAEAKQKGWLKTCHEFTWWYPWYRLHFVGKYGGETMIDVGVAVFPRADKASFPDAPLKRKVNEWFGKVLWTVLTGIVATEFAIWLGSHFGPIYFALALVSYIGYKVVNLYALNWDSLENLCVSLVSTITSLAISAWTGLCKFLPESLRALASGAESIKNVLFVFLCKIIMIPVNIYLLMATWDRIVDLGGA